MKGFEVVFGDGDQRVQTALNGIRGLLRDVEAGYEAAVMRALNRSVVTGRVAVVKEVRKVYTVKAKTVREHFKIKKAKVRDLEAVLSAQGHPLPIYGFKFTPKSDTTGNTRKRVRVAVRNDGGLKPLGATFVWRGLVLHREGTESLPVHLIYGPSVPSMAGNTSVAEMSQKTMREAFLKRLDHEVKEVLREAEENCGHPTGRNGGMIHG